MNPTTLGRLFGAIQCEKGFPTLERTATSVLGSLVSNNKANQDVLRHIIEDFSLTQKVLKLANSSMYEPFATAPATVASALDVLGSDALLHLVLGTPLITDAELQADENLSRNLFASELARSALADRAEDVSIATMMFDLGRLMVAKYLPIESASIEKKISFGAISEVAECEVLGLTLQQIGSALAKHWKLPASIVATINGTGDPTLVGIARFASLASALIHAGKADAANSLVAELDIPGVDKSKLSLLVNCRLDEIQVIAKTYPVNSAVHLLNDLLTTLVQEKKKTIDELAVTVFAAFGQSLHTARCLLFMLTRTGDFRVRCGYGKGIDELKSKLKITSEFKPTAFHAVIKNNVDVSITDIFRLKPSALPEGYRQLLPHVSKFIILPIANSRVTGLLYCDWDSDKAISQTEMEVVKKLRNLFMPLFPQ